MNTNPFFLAFEDEFFLMTIPCHQDMISTSTLPINDSEKEIFDNRLLQILGQSFVKAQELVYQSIISNKLQLLHILEQLSVKVWDKSRKFIDKSVYSSYTIELIEYLKIGYATIKTLAESIECEDTTELRRKFILPLIEMGYISMTMPDKPTSSKQEYRLTEKGFQLFSIF